MTEQTMPADKAREIIGGMRESMRRAEYDGTSPKFMGSMLVYVAALEALLPPPPRPTLAGIPRKERDGYRWMQADVKGRSARYVIATPSDRNGLAGLVSADGGIEWTYPERITPRPDLPRMEWPGTGQGVEDAATAKAGTVIESANDPRLAALPVGTILRDCDGEEVVKRGGDWAGIGYVPIPSQGNEFGPWTVLHVG